MPPAPKTSLTLMARIAASADDASVWADFVATYGIHVVSWCRRYGLNDPDAHDLSQDVLLRFWREASRFQYDPARRFRAYLRRITEAALHDWQAGLAIGVQGQGGTRVLKFLEALPAREDLITRLEQAFDQELFERAKVEVQARVEPRTWAAFELLAVQGLSGQEVSDKVGLSVNQTYVARNRVQRMLRETVDQLELSLLQP